MKNKIILSIFIIVQFIFNIKSISAMPNIDYTMEQKAIREVANSYYVKGINGQYCDGGRKSYMSTPEDATSQHTIYSVCSGFTYSVYYNAFGIQIPGDTASLITYAKKYYDTDNIITNDVIEYWEASNDDDGNRIYKDNKGNIKDIDLSIYQGGRTNYASILLKMYNLQVGDLLVNSRSESVWRTCCYGI